MRRREFPIALSDDFKGKATVHAFLAGERAKGDDRRAAAADARSKREAALVGLIIGLTVYAVARILGFM